MKELILYITFFLIGILGERVNCLTESWVFFSPRVNSFYEAGSVQKCYLIDTREHYLLDMLKILGFCTSLHHLQLSAFRFGCKPKTSRRIEHHQGPFQQIIFGRKFLFILFQQ